MDDVDVLVRQGSTQPLDVTITDEDGDPMDLTDATVQVVAYAWMLDPTTGQLVELWRADATVDPDQQANPGHVTYAWQAADVATPGNYRLAFSITFPVGGPAVPFPSDGPLSFTVAEVDVDTDPLVVDARSVALRVGIPDSALTDELKELLEDLILDAQTDVEGYLRRPLGVLRFTEVALFDATSPGSGPLATAWSSKAPGFGLALRWDPVVRVLSAADNGDGTATVSYLAGLDVRGDRRYRPILRYVRSAAADEFMTHPAGAAYRQVSSKSAGGRSITYDKPAAAMRRASTALPALPQPGAPPSIETLSRFRRRAAFSRPRWVGAGAYGAGAFGYGGGGVDWQPPDGLFDRDDRTGEVWPAATP